MSSASDIPHKRTTVRSHLMRTVFTLVKIVLGLAILAYLLYSGRASFAQLSKQTIQWPMLAAALVFSMATALLSFVRWHILLVALGINVRLGETLRLGALGFALNFVSPGSIGGDFFKAIFLAHGKPKQRTEAIASIVADRVMGLVTMLVVASGGILALGLLKSSSGSLRLLCQLMLLLTFVGLAGCFILLAVRSLTSGWIRTRAESIPVVGHTIGRLMGTVQVYRGQPGVIAISSLISLAMVLCYTTSYYLVARGLPMHEPTWEEHLVIVPVAGLAGSLPITPNGLGTTEFAIDSLYQAMPGGQDIKTGDGTMVSLGRRLTDIAVAMVGMVFYMLHRREVQEAYAEAEELEEEGLLE